LSKKRNPFNFPFFFCIYYITETKKYDHWKRDKYVKGTLLAKWDGKMFLRAAESKSKI
jgi:hypothetical protein